MIDSRWWNEGATLRGMTTPTVTIRQIDQPLKISRWASLGVVLFAVLALLLPAGEIVAPWLFAIGLIGWVMTSLMLGWRESKRKEAAKLRRN